LWAISASKSQSHSLEFRLAGALDLDSANAMLRKFLGDYNRRFTTLGHPRGVTLLCCHQGDKFMLLHQLTFRGGQRR
jgi:hypothetical protein